LANDFEVNPSTLPSLYAAYAEKHVWQASQGKFTCMVCYCLVLALWSCLPDDDIGPVSLQGGQGGGLHLEQINNISLLHTTIANNTATQSGGGAAVLACGSLLIANSSILSNRATLGGGLAVDHISRLELRSVTLSNNAAQPQPAGGREEAVSASDVAEETVLEQPEEGDGRKLLQDGEAKEAEQQPSALAQFASVRHLVGTGGALLVQNSPVKLSHSTFANNTGSWSAGGLLLHQPVSINMVSTMFEHNVAERGPAGALLLRAPATADFTACNFVHNKAPNAAGGAILLDAGLGQLEVACKDCIFTDNFAGQVGMGHNVPATAQCSQHLKALYFLHAVDVERSHPTFCSCMLR